MASPLSRFARRVSPAVGRLGPAVRLARADVALARAWLRGDAALRETLGERAAQSFTQLVVDTASFDVRIARTLAHALPDRLAALNEAGRGRLIRLLGVVRSQRPEALPLLLRTAPLLLARLDDDQLARWVARGLELHRESPRKAESFLRMESEQSQREVVALDRGVTLASVQRTLSLYAQAHCGEDVTVRAGHQRAYTDGRNLFLPARVDRFGDDRDFSVYRVLTAVNAGFIEFGSRDLDLSQIAGDWPHRRPGELEVERFTRGFGNHVLARDLFRIYEDIRIEERVRTEYPGIARDMAVVDGVWRPSLRDLTDLTPVEQAVEWIMRVAIGAETEVGVSGEVGAAAQVGVDALKRVREPTATVADSALAVLDAYAGVSALMKYVDDEDRDRDEEEGTDDTAAGHAGGLDVAGELNQRGQPTVLDPDLDVTAYRPVDREPLASGFDVAGIGASERTVEDEAHAIFEAIQDTGGDVTLTEARQQARTQASSFEEMAAFLDRNEGPAGPALEPPREGAGSSDAARPAVGASLERDASTTGEQFLYPEWDSTIGDYKPAWVRLTEYRLDPGSTDFVRQVESDFGPLIQQVRRSFEALRPEAARRMRGLTSGDEIDLDRAIQARVEWKAGGGFADRIYSRRVRQDRDVAVAFLVDLSSSTNEVVNADQKRVIDVAKEALVLICEAIEAIGDRCAIWGFSGYGRDQVAFYVAKELDEPYNDGVRQRIGRMSWKMENRDGAAIRHATARLRSEPARVRLLLMLSDGRPLDCGCDHYADRYAQQDTRTALAEARQEGIHPFCITVDPLGQSYLREMYGESGFTVIDRVEKLPERLPLIYRRLTR